MIANIRTGMVGSMVPVGVNCSSRDRCPSWKIHTTTPYMADSDSTFIAIALTGSTTDPNARNSSTNVASPTTSPIHGKICPRLDSSSTSCAVGPPTYARATRAVSRRTPVTCAPLTPGTWPRRLT